MGLFSPSYSTLLPHLLLLLQKLLRLDVAFSPVLFHGGVHIVWVYLEGDLGQAVHALDVEPEDGQAQICLVLDRFLERIEQPIVDAFSTYLAPHVEGGISRTTYC